MSYFNPKIYNMNNLKPADQKEIQTADWLMTSVLNSMLFDYDEDETENILDRIAHEVARDVLKNLAYRYQVERAELIVATMDDYEEEYEVDELEEWDEWKNPFDEIEGDLE